MEPGMSLESRIKRLEQAYTPAEQPLVVLLDWKLSDKVLGMSLGDVPTDEFFVRPAEGESEEEFCDRGAELAKSYVRSHPTMAQGCVCAWRCIGPNTNSGETVGSSGRF